MFIYVLILIYVFVYFPLSYLDHLVYFTQVEHMMIKPSEVPPFQPHLHLENSWEYFIYTEIYNRYINYHIFLSHYAYQDFVNTQFKQNEQLLILCMQAQQLVYTELEPYLYILMKQDKWSHVYWDSAGFNWGMVS